MRGGFVHNEVLVRQLDDCLSQIGAKTQREVYVTKAGKSGFVDLLATWGPFKIACEVELTTDRVLKDVRNAKAAEADLLFIVTTTRRMAVAIRAHLRRAGVSSRGSGPLIWISALGPAVQRLSNKGHLMYALNDHRSSIHQSSKHPEIGGSKEGGAS